jgi:hypothetical protein
MLVDDAGIRGQYSVVLYCTDVDEKNGTEHRQPMRRRHTIDNASGNVVPAGALRENSVPRVDDMIIDDDGCDPIHGRQREHGGNHGEEPFP